MVVLQALSEYLVRNPSPSDMNLRVHLSVPGRSDIRWAFTKHLAHVARSSRVSYTQFELFLILILVLFSAIFFIELPAAFSKL